MDLKGPTSKGKEDMKREREGERKWMGVDIA